MRAREEREFREFVAARMTALRRFAYLLCGDPHGADDVVSATLAKLFRHCGSPPPTSPPPWPGPTQRTSCGCPRATGGSSRERF